MQAPVEGGSLSVKGRGRREKEAPAPKRKCIIFVQKKKVTQKHLKVKISLQQFFLLHVVRQLLGILVFSSNR